MFRKKNTCFNYFEYSLKISLELFKILHCGMFDKFWTSILFKLIYWPPLQIIQQVTLSHFNYMTTLYKSGRGKEFFF
jgi:hypothetical protein